MDEQTEKEMIKSIQHIGRILLVMTALWGIVIVYIIVRFNQ